MSSSDASPQALKPPRFDPRAVPVARVDQHLPALPPAQLSASAVVQRCAQERPWQPEFEREPRMSDRPSTAAAVLVPLVVQDDGLAVLLTQRTAHLRSHSGQIAFPGGKADAQDRDAADTALRETQEEIGLERSLVQVLCTLPQYRTGSGFVVTPVLALVPALGPLAPNVHEVADVFTVPLAFLMNPAHHRHHEVWWEGEMRHWMSMPYQDGGQERFIWGATAAMLRNLYRFLAAR
ncbi:MAG: CoA pyrophosphatase [Rhodoferax sp.]